MEDFTLRNEIDSLIPPKDRELEKLLSRYSNSKPLTSVESTANSNSNTELSQFKELVNKKFNSLNSIESKTENNGLSLSIDKESFKWLVVMFFILILVLGLVWLLTRKKYKKRHKSGGK